MDLEHWLLCKYRRGAMNRDAKQLFYRDEQAQRVSLSTPVLMSALFTYHNLTILLKACNSIFYEIAHAILLQLIHI